MARQRGQGPQRPIKGFRPGKEPPQLRKKRAKQELGQGNATQEKLVEFFASRTPAESRALLRRWRIGLLVAAVVLGIGGVLLYGWSVIVAVLVHLLGGISLFLWWQLHRQREALNAMADMVGGGRSRR